jgi:hypothetical protein
MAHYAFLLPLVGDSGNDLWVFVVAMYTSHVTLRPFCSFSSGISSAPLKDRSHIMMSSDQGQAVTVLGVCRAGECGWGSSAK